MPSTTHAEESDARKPGISELASTLIGVTDPDQQPTRQDIERQVRDYFPSEVAACEEFLDFAAEMMEASPWRGRPVRDSQPADRLIAAEAARGLKTYRGSLDASLGGFGPQAAMLNRALFEGMATTCWACRNPKLAAERFAKHQCHHRALWSKRYLASGVIQAPLPDLPGPREMRELDRLFGRWGDKLWCGMPLHKLVDEISEQWDDRMRLKGFFVIAHASNNELQHTTVRSIMQPVRETDTNFQVDAGPSLQGVQQALHGALWTYAYMLRAVADYFEVHGRGVIMSLFQRCESVFWPLDSDLLRKTGRNDQCPCGSGRKFKHCHGK